MTARTSKSISERIEADYYKHPHPMRKVKRWLSWGLLVASLVLVLIPVLIGRQEVFQAAPVSKAHQFIANDCGRCHVESWQPALRLVTLDANHRSTTDAACRACHNTADHFGSLPGKAAPHCADCHREHRPGVDLARASDRFCIACHATLTAETATGRKILPVKDIASHPEMAIFRSDAAIDPTNLHFNHSLHVAKGGIAGPDGQKVVLDCASCHQPDATRHRMMPVTYAAHCAQCHSSSLQFDQERFPGKRVPHASPDVVRGFLREQYFHLAAQGQEAGADSGLPQAPEPQSQAERAEAHRLERAALRKLLGDPGEGSHGVNQAEYQVFARSGGCRYCHTVELVNSDPAGQPQPAATAWQVVPPSAPGRWMHGAVFPHVSHRMLTCVACHPVEGSSKTSDVNLPAIDNCKQCHAPAIAGSMAASSHCTACHNYHDHKQDVDFNGTLTLELTKYLQAEPTPSPGKPGENGQ